MDDNEQNRRVSVKSRVSQSKRVLQTHSPRPAKVAAFPFAWKEDIKSLLISLDPKFQQSVGFPACGVKRNFVQRDGGPWLSVFWWLRFSSHGGHDTHHPKNMSSRGFYCLFQDNDVMVDAQLMMKFLNNLYLFFGPSIRLFNHPIMLMVHSHLMLSQC